MLSCIALHTTLVSQSYQSRISEARSSATYSTQQQIENLLLLEEELLTKSFKDTLGTVEYFLAMRYRRLSDNKNLIEHATKAIGAYEQSSYKGYRLSFSYLIRCLANNQLGNNEKAMADALAIESLEVNGRGFEALGDAIKFQVETFRNNGDFESSINKLNNFLITDRADSLNNYFKSNLFLELSMAYSNYEDSLSLRKAIETIDSVNVLIPDINNQYLYRDKTKILSFSQLGHIYAQLEDWNMSIKYYEEALGIANSLSLDTDVNRFRMLSKVNLIELYGKTAQLDKIDQFVKESVEEEYSYYNPMVYAAYYENLATHFRMNEELDIAFSYLEKAKNVLNHPEDKLQIQKHKQRLSKALHEEVKVNYAYYSSTENENWLTKATNTMMSLDSLIDLIGLDLLFDSSVYEWRETAKSFYDTGLKVAFAKNDVELFWRFAEKTKNLALLETIIRTQRENRTSEYEAVNSELISLRRSESILFAEIEFPNIDLHVKDSLETELINNKNAQLKLYLEEQEKLSKIIPDVVTIKDIQQVLQNKTLILYSNDSEYLYGVSINSSHSEMKQLIKLSELENKLEKWYQYLLREVNADDEDLMSELIQLFKSLEKSIVIIPDEYVRVIPFAALKNESGTYAIEEYTFSYDISATFFYYHNKSDQLQIHNSTVVTPTYTNRDLSFTQNEANDIAEILDADILSDSDAITSNFIQKLKQNELLHFSGHLESNEGELSMLLSENENISVDDIYHSESNIKFLFMNACESASGKVLTGEGTANFARAFMQTGSETIIQTLWNVNDYSSAVIADQLYKELHDGKPVDEAMRLAQLNYFEQADDFARHPYYWASIGVLGKTDTIHLSIKFKVYLWLGLSMLVFILLFILFSKYKVKA